MGGGVFKWLRVFGVYGCAMASDEWRHFYSFLRNLPKESGDLSRVSARGLKRAAQDSSLMAVTTHWMRQNSS